MVEVALLALAKVWPYLAGLAAIATVFGATIFNARRSGRDRERVRNYERQEESRRAAHKLVEEARNARARARADRAFDSLHNNKRPDKYRRD